MDNAGVDVDEEMVEVADQGDRPDLDRVQIPMGVSRRPDTQFRMELGGQLC